MSVDSDLYSAVSGATDALDRLFPQTLPQPTALPAIVYQRISTTLEQSMNGHALGAQWPRFQFDAYDLSGDGARAVRQQVLAAMLPLVGQSVNFFGLSFENAWDGYEPETRLYRASMELVVGHDGN